MSLDSKPRSGDGVQTAKQSGTVSFRLKIVQRHLVNKKSDCIIMAIRSDKFNSALRLKKGNKKP